MIDELSSKASLLDQQDPLSKYRQEFYIPKNENGEELLYFTGNSLGLQPKKTATFLQQELEDWAKLGVEGHIHAGHPWLPYHEFLSQKMAQIVGAKPEETVVMNSLTVNLHLMMVSFYRPQGKRRKILMEYSPFPSDIYAVKSQIRYHGGNEEDDIIFLTPDEGEVVSDDQIKNTIEEHADDLALVLIGGVNYYTGQYYPLKKIVQWGHLAGAKVGFDMAHGAGNVPMQLHDSGADFAVWCSYKYLNSGPGSLAGCFVHERHHSKKDMPRFEGWWGQDKETRFLMEDEFKPIPTVEAWQLSNPPILSMTAVLASLDVFAEAGFEQLVEKSKKLTGFMEECLQLAQIPGLKIITPKEPERRGCQLSLVFEGRDKSFYEQLLSAGVIADWREPNVVRIAPVPLYNTYADAANFVRVLLELTDN